MTPEEAFAKAKEIVEKHTDSSGYNPDDGHLELDDLLCDVLRQMGYVGLVDFYEKQERRFE